MKLERYSRAAVAGSADLFLLSRVRSSLAAKLPCWATPARSVMLWPLGNMAWPLLGARVKRWFENIADPQKVSLKLVTRINPT